jgi:hypothetical protein
MILFVNKIQIKWGWHNHIEIKKKEILNLNSKQIKCWMMKLKNKIKKKK